MSLHVRFHNIPLSVCLLPLGERFGGLETAGVNLVGVCIGGSPGFAADYQPQARQDLVGERWFLWCVTSEDKVARFGLIVAGKAGLHERRGGRFAVLEVSKTPTASRGVLFCIFDHKLNVRWGAGYERLGLAKDFVVFLRRHVTVMQSGNDRAVWERDLPFAVGLDR